MKLANIRRKPNSDTGLQHARSSSAESWSGQVESIEEFVLARWQDADRSADTHTVTSRTFPMIMRMGMYSVIQAHLGSFTPPELDRLFVLHGLALLRLRLESGETPRQRPPSPAGLRNWVPGEFSLGRETARQYLGERWFGVSMAARSLLVRLAALHGGTQGHIAILAMLAALATSNGSIPESLRALYEAEVGCVIGRLRSPDRPWAAPRDFDRL